MKIRTLLIVAFICLCRAVSAETPLGGDCRIGGYLRGGGASTSTSLTSSSIAYGNGAWSGGHSSAAFGYHARTYAAYGASFGIETESKSYNCFVIGRYNISSGYTADNYIPAEPAFAIGDGTSHTVRSDSFKILKNGDTFIYGSLSISPDSPVAATNTISGTNSVGIGTSLTITGAYQTVLGRFNTQGNYSLTGWQDTDPIFVIGNGTSTSQRSDALVILKNGDTKINGDTAVSGEIRVRPGSDISMGTYTQTPGNIGQP